jgi:butyrate kinase
MTTYLIERVGRDARGRIVDVMWFTHVQGQPASTATSNIVSAQTVVKALHSGAQVKLVIGRSVVGDDVFVSADGTTIIDSPMDALFKLGDLPELRPAA